MVYFSGCKINIGLNILEKLPDGYHRIETVFYPIPWNDVIEFLPASATRIDILGSTLQSLDDNNLVIRAYKLLRTKYTLPELHFALLKNIPVGAGLGGGSANAAIALTALNTEFELGCSREDLIKFASQLGSDCCFFIDNQPAYGSNKGEVLTPVRLPLDSYYVAILYPDIHIDTTWAYKSYAMNHPKSQSPSLLENLQQPVSEWKNTLKNDFERIVFEAHPQIESFKKKLYGSGAVYASMSGSGSAVYGIFESEPDIRFIAEDMEINERHWFVRRPLVGE